MYIVLFPGCIKRTKTHPAVKWLRTKHVMWMDNNYIILCDGIHWQPNMQHKELWQQQGLFFSPDESKDLQVPSGLSIPSFMNCTEVLGLRIKLTPPTRAASHWPWRMAWNALSNASRLEEQAVSMAVLGPERDSTADQRFKPDLTGRRNTLLTLNNPFN